MSNLADFVATHLGAATTAGDPFGAQCTALIYAYCDFLGASRLSGDAIDFAAQPNPAAAWIPAGQGLPEPGDVVVWGETDSLGIGPLGHTDIVVDSVTVTGFRGLDQNWFDSNPDHGSPAAFVNHDYRGVLGWHHFKEKAMHPALKRATVRSWFIAGLGREPSEADLEQFAGALADDGSNADAIAASIFDSAEAQAHRTAGGATGPAGPAGPPGPAPDPAALAVEVAKHLSVQPK